MIITFNYYSKYAGKQVVFDDSVVITYIDTYGADIVYRKFTKNYDGYADRKYLVRKINRRYKTLESAVKAFIKSSQQLEVA